MPGNARNSKRSGFSVNRGALNPVVSSSDSSPNNPRIGDLNIKDLGNDNLTIYRWNGSAWKAVISGIYIGTTAPSDTTLLWLDTN